MGPLIWSDFVLRSICRRVLVTTIIHNLTNEGHDLYRPVVAFLQLGGASRLHLGITAVRGKGSLRYAELSAVVC